MVVVTSRSVVGGGITAAAEIPAVWAAMGVDFLMFLKPSVPQDVLTMEVPVLSVTWMCVLVDDRTTHQNHCVTSHIGSDCRCTSSNLSYGSTDRHVLSKGWALRWRPCTSEVVDLDSLVVCCFNVSDGKLLERPPCPAQRTVLPGEWRHVAGAPEEEASWLLIINRLRRKSRDDGLTHLNSLELSAGLASSFGLAALMDNVR